MSTEAVVDAIKYIFTKRIQVDGETLVEDVERSDFTPQEYLIEVVNANPYDDSDSLSSDPTRANSHSLANNAEDDPDQPIRMKERIVETGEGKYRQRWRRTQ